MAFFLSSISVAGAFSGIAAYGLLQLDGVASLKGWQWLFLIEGLPSIVFGLLTLFVLPVSPDKVDLLTPEEKDLAKSRVDIPEKHSISVEQMKQAFTDPRIWLAAFLSCTQCIVLYSVSFFLPAIIRQFGFSDIISNLLSVPVYILSAIAIIWNGFHSDKTSERFLHILIPNILSIIFWSLEAYSLTNSNIGFQYSMIIGAAFTSMMTTPISLIWPLDFIQGSTISAVAPGIIVGIGNIGGIIGPQIFGISYTYSGTYVWAAVAMAISSFLSCILSYILYLHTQHPTPLVEPRYSMTE